MTSAGDRSADLEAQLKRLSAQVVALTRQNQELIAMHVAMSRLAEATSTEDGLAAVREIIVNMLGSETFVIYEVDALRQALRLFDAEGMESLAPLERPFGSDPVGMAARQGQPYVAPAASDRAARGRAVDMAEPVLCIPFTLGGEVTHVVAVHDFMPQKEPFGPFDESLVQVLAVHGGPALRGVRARPSLGA